MAPERWLTFSLFNKSFKWGEAVGSRIKSRANDHLLPRHWSGCNLLCYGGIVRSWSNCVGATLQGRAVRQHGARSETFWASCIMLFVFPGNDGRVTARTESLPESQMDYVQFLPVSLLSSPSSAPLTFMRFAGNRQHHWCGPFLCVAWEQSSCASIGCSSRRSPALPCSFAVCLPLIFSNLSLYLAFISWF